MPWRISSKKYNIHYIVFAQVKYLLIPSSKEIKFVNPKRFSNLSTFAIAQESRLVFPLIPLFLNLCLE